MKPTLSLFSLLLPALALAPANARAQGLASPQTEALGAPLSPNAAAVLAPSAGAPALEPAPTLAPAEEPRTLARAINLPAQQKMPESFGAPHQLVLGGSTALNVHGYHAQLQRAKVDTFSLDFSPWVGGFVARHFLLGLQLPISYARGIGNWYANVGVGPFVGWHVPVSTHFGLLPRVGLHYQFGRSRTSSAPGLTLGDSHALYVSGRLDAVVHLTHHLSVALGPYATWSAVNRMGGNKQPWLTYYGLQVSLLGWI